MERIKRLFEQKSEQILSIYFTAGFPGLDDTATIASCLEQAGADLIEIGMPYSDPLADGPTIQGSGQVALRNGMTLNRLFDQIASFRDSVNLPVILMGYFNQVMQYGEERFFRQCREVGVDGLILPDLPPDEYDRKYRSMVESLDLGISFLVTPQTSEERIRQIDELSRGFIYAVADAAITGNQKGISDRQLAYFRYLRELNLRNPHLIGFGISDHQSFRSACQYAPGAIIGSAFIRSLEQSGSLEEKVSNFIQFILQEKASQPI